MILAGLSGIIVIEIYAAVMQREFQNTENRVGKGFAVLGIYLFVVWFCKSSPQPPVLCGADEMIRWHAQLHNLALRRRSPSHGHPKQSHGAGSCLALHRQCRRDRSWTVGFCYDQGELLL